MRDILDLENQRENAEQPFLSVFKKGRRRVPVRNLGKVVHYAKVQLRFLHSQDVSDCYLELFPAHLYFQAHGSEGLTFQVRRWAAGVRGHGRPSLPGSLKALLSCARQGLLPLTELSVCALKGSREHGFQITGPLPAPLLVLCPGRAELDCWLYHLEKQMALLGGLRRCHSAPPQVSPRDPTALPALILAACSDRLLTGVPWRGATLDSPAPSHPAADGIRARTWRQCHLCLEGQTAAPARTGAQGLPYKGLALVLPPQGELPLRAVHINLEEKEKEIRSFLIEGPLINTIRVVCSSYEDYSHWLLCLRAVTRREGVRQLPGTESFLGMQVMGSARGSLSSGGPTSWDLECLAPPSTRTSHSLPESSVPPTVGSPSLYTPDPADSDPTSICRRRTELRRSGSSRSPRSKARAEGRGLAAPLHLDLTQLNRLSLEGPGHTETPHSPLYADPYTPPATSHRRITDVQGLEEVSPLLSPRRGGMCGHLRSGGACTPRFGV
ncbi:Pleckstrin y domain-containing N member 1 [Saguinus oedipus]|uniref:Pleckstrin y domain-containing N member 1 n=1 Tax=Saguinus oedipus TaxID=9490 RepID=A0ABQ9V892_SAGOE|nr:Pleckstrin y domain-containing N member 1 [Saguinus oedipus]